MTIPLSTLRKFAELSTHAHHSHATLVVKGGAILAFGYNHGTCHSEVNALKKLWPSKRHGTSIINIMITKKKRVIGNSRPCDDCWGFLLVNKVKKVIYSTEVGFVEERI